MLYFNNIHILYYVLIGVIGIIVGQFMDWCNVRLVKHKKVFSKELIKEYRKGIKPNYILIIVMPILYIALLYRFGMANTFTQNLDLIKYVILIPMLLLALIIDFKHQIIPNRLNLTIFEVGLVFTFLYGISSINVAVDMFLGMLVGGGIFLIITLLGGLIAGKEAMGFGDVKLVGALGLFFGMYSIIAISVTAFLVGAVVSVVAVFSKKTDGYIPFGPSIVIASIISIFVPFPILLNILLKIFTLGMYKGTI